MYFLTDEACSPLALTEKEYSWMVGQLRAKRSAELKKAMTEYIESFGFKVECGSFTDISIISPVWKTAAVNL